MVTLNLGQRLLGRLFLGNQLYVSAHMAARIHKDKWSVQQSDFRWLKKHEGPVVIRALVGVFWDRRAFLWLSYKRPR